MLSLVIENVRTFVGRHDIPLTPLTVLIGENSTGKSSFLAVLGAVTDPLGFPFTPAFNRPPYQLGNYDTIATYKGGKYGRAKSFTIGYSEDRPRRGVATSAEATYRGRDGQPELAQFMVRGTGGYAKLTMAPEAGRGGYSGKVHVALEGLDETFPFSIPRVAVEGRSLTLPDLLFAAQAASATRDFSRHLDLINRVSKVAYLFAPIQSESIAPIRTKPERTYSQITEEYNPSGDQIPFVLERLARDEHSRESQTVMRALERFGEESGLFRALRVRKLGSKAGEPFQIMVNIGGRDRNLVDVGYGVSQALPVIVQSALTPSNQLLLIQQPEVHLHPRAQAALGTFLAELVAGTDKRFVIESHSDFVIDRIRQEVAAGRVPASAVSLLFFERSKMETVVHQIRLDDQGNVLGAPPSYREFFLEEELNLLRRVEHVPNS